MANRGRCVIVGHAQRGAIVKTRKRSMASRVEERELAMSESGASPTMLDLARLLRVTNADESMLRLSEVMDRSTGLFRNSPDFAIPEIRFSQIEDGRFPYYVTRQLNRRGVLVVREAVPTDTAVRWRDDLMEYLEVNGVSDGSAGVKDVFWSKTQAQAREHRGVRAVLSALNRLWKPDSLAPVDLTKSLSYCDRAFVGKPTSSSLLAGTSAVMAGGPSASSRWLNPHHQEAYRDILDGRWEDWDPFKAGPRIRAVDYPALSHGPGRGGGLGGMRVLSESGGKVPPQAFRPFQGYLSFGRWGDVGNVHVVPMMRVATAYMLLRPFMSDMLGVAAEDDSWLCGAGNGQELVLSPKWHQPILDALVRLPPLSPGDAVFWHTDIVHCEASALPRSAAAAERAAVSAEIESARSPPAAAPTTTTRRPSSDGVTGAGLGSADDDNTGRVGRLARVWGPRGGRGDGDGLGRFDPAMFAGVHLSSLPICEANARYVKAQGEAFLKGVRPPSFGGCVGGVGREEGEEGASEECFVGRASREDLTRGGMQAMGLRRFRKEHSNAALERHHQLLDLPYQW